MTKNELKEEQRCKRWHNKVFNIMKELEGLTFDEAYHILKGVKGNLEDINIVKCDKSKYLKNHNDIEKYFE
jgi:hypothetical protein